MTTLKEHIKCSWRYCILNHVHAHKLFHLNNEIHMNRIFAMKNILTYFRGIFFPNTKIKSHWFQCIENYLRNIRIRMQTKDLWAIHGREWLDVFKILAQGFAHWNFISSVKTESAVKHLFIKPHLHKIQRKKHKIALPFGVFNFSFGE